MAVKEKTTVVKTELQDLSIELQELAIGKQECFYQYRPRGSAGTRIYQELVKKYNEDGNRILFSDELRESGLLSVCQGLSSITSVIEKLDVSTKDHKALLDDLVTELLRIVEPTPGKFRIDASPYLEGSEFFNDHVYVDGATWVLSSVLGLVRLNINGKYELDDAQRGKLVALYNFCLDKVISSYISPTSSKFDAKGSGFKRIDVNKFNTGWNFTDGCEEPSLYFTFAVSEVLIDILTTFENVIRSADVELVQQNIINELDRSRLLESDRYKRNKDRIDEALRIAFEDTDVEGTGNAMDQFREFSPEERALIAEIYQKCRFIEEQCEDNTKKIEQNTGAIQKEIEFFYLLNAGKSPYESDSPYAMLEGQCKSSAEGIWNLTKDDLSDAFYSSDLSSRVAEANIESSVSSDAVFNVIFAINTIINAGLDEDAEDQINYYTINGSSAYNAALAKYDNMRDTLRLAYENCYQFFTYLKKNNKEYKINEYTLNFDENFVKHSQAVRDLRKSRIRVFSLMPLLVRTKTTIGEFLIQYPQYDMMLFLEQILKYRCWDVSEAKYLWIWENDAYSSSSNYYFISALAAFYDYYYKYENVFLKNANNNREARKEIEKKYHKQLEEKGKAVDKDVSEFEAQEQRIRELAEEIEALGAEIQGYRNDPLRSALSGFIAGVIKETIVEILADRIGAETQKMLDSTKERLAERVEKYGRNPEITEWESAPDENKGPFAKGVEDLIIAMLAEQMGEAVFSVKQTAAEREAGIDKMGSLVKKTGRDLRQAARYYLSGIVRDGQSDFVRNKGESTLSAGDHRAMMQLIEDKHNKGGRD